VWRAPQAAFTNRRGRSDEAAVGVEAADATPDDLALAAAEILPDGGINFESDCEAADAVDADVPNGVLELPPLGDDVFLLLTASRSRSEDVIDSESVTLIRVGIATNEPMLLLVTAEDVFSIPHCPNSFEPHE
jgi:hypothetical protein